MGVHADAGAAARAWCIRVSGEPAGDVLKDVKRRDRRDNSLCGLGVDPLRSLELRSSWLGREVYHIIEGTATLVLGPDITNRQRRPATQQTIREFNGPGHNGSEIRNGVSYNLKAGDVVVIPAGTGHHFTKIDDHIDYLMVRIDPDKITPIKDEAASKAYLATPSAGNPQQLLGGAALIASSRLLLCRIIVPLSVLLRRVDLDVDHRHGAAVLGVMGHAFCDRNYIAGLVVVAHVPPRLRQRALHHHDQRVPAGVRVVRRHDAWRQG
jgi:hypothetical protein